MYKKDWVKCSTIRKRMESILYNCVEVIKYDKKPTVLCEVYELFIEFLYLYNVAQKECSSQE